MKSIDLNYEIHCIGILLKQNREGNILGKFIDSKNLDFSIESLKLVDKYLEKIRKKSLSENDVKKIILRCGTYLGEVIRKRTPKIISWITFEKANEKNDLVHKLGKDLTTHILLINKNNNSLWFQLSKIYKFIEYGKQDNLTSFAKVMLDDINKNEKKPKILPER